MDKRLVLALTSLLLCVFGLIGSTVYYLQLQFQSIQLSRSIEIALSRPKDSYRLQPLAGSNISWGEKLIPIILAAMAAFLIFRIVGFIVAWKRQNTN